MEAHRVWTLVVSPVSWFEIFFICACGLEFGQSARHRKELGQAGTVVGMRKAEEIGLAGVGQRVDRPGKVDPVLCSECSLAKPSLLVRTLGFVWRVLQFEKSGTGAQTNMRTPEKRC